MAKKLSVEWVYEFTGEFVPSTLAKMSPADKERFKYLRWAGIPSFGFGEIMDICDKDGVMFDDFAGRFHHSAIGRRVKKIAK